MAIASTEFHRPHVLILGAGLGGLCLAQSLRKHGVSFEIFEKDASLHARLQGWAIALHTILRDLRQSVPDDLPPIEVTNHLLPLDLPTEFVMYAQDGSRYISASSEDHVMFRANRAKLRNWLAHKIDVQWNMSAASIEDDASGVTLHFADGTSAMGDVLVGCDGVHSTVRAHLFPQKDLLQTLPVGIIIGEAILNKEQYERQLSLGHSFYIALGPQLRLFCGLNSIAPDAESGYYFWVLMWEDSAASQEPYWTKHASKQACLDAALEKTKSLDSRFTELIRLTSVKDVMTPPIVFRDILLEAMPAGRRVTLLGDAAHAMAPARGEGGNHALQDALNLGRALGRSNKDNVFAMLDEYQQEMLTRSAKAVIASREASQDNGEGTRTAFANFGR